MKGCQRIEEKCFFKAVVDGDSMEKTFQNKDRVLVDKKIYKKKGLQRYDIIIAQANNLYTIKEDKNNDIIYINDSDKSKVDEKKLKHLYILKRVIGLPRETIYIKNSKIYINGKQIDDIIYKGNYFQAGRAKKKITLKEDEYFLLGDNREKSMDSRREEIGNVKENDILGKILFRYHPLIPWSISKN